jgi:hypothetical protein
LILTKHICINNIVDSPERQQPKLSPDEIQAHVLATVATLTKEGHISTEEDVKGTLLYLQQMKLELLKLGVEDEEMPMYTVGMFEVMLLDYLRQ